MAKKTPQDRVGHTIPTSTQSNDTRTMLKNLLILARSLGPSLTKEERKRVGKPRKGSEGHVKRILELAQTHKLSSRNYSPEGIKSDMELFTAIEDTVKDAYLVWTAFRDVYLQARSEYWEGFLHFYGALTHLAETDAEVAAEIAPIVEFVTPRTTAAPDETQSGEDGLE
jgi:hypothetical protein